MADGSRPPPRQPRDFQDLLRLCMETVPQDPSSVANDQELHPLDPQRRQWLSEALSSMTTDVLREMLTNLDVIKNGLNETTADGLLSMETVDKIQTAIDALIDRTGSLDSAQDFCKIGGFDVFPGLLASTSDELRVSACDLRRTGSLDSAQDFCKIGGFDVFPGLLASTSDELRVSACELLAEVVQNESSCQQQALDSHLLDLLVRLLDDKTVADKVRVKSLYAISCVIRDNDRALQVFSKDLDGLSVLINAVATSATSAHTDNRLKIKASFLMSSLCQKPDICQSMYDLGLLDQLISGLQGPHDSTHEYVLATLYALVSAHPQSRADCRHIDRQMKHFLTKRINELNGTEELVEELDYCKRLFEILFVDNDLPESER
ncbi:unnamed protein product [Oppiella nova]|uniref:Hsp70-binding protein 1 n=1 Tax=Oppiella nova TaxID=334625 RepID=A0A7R9LZQ8_9ACAR|nr:unnamed protein product [Oppiella nova]CAG2168559.1 unnamed protein product [Oppiella nova]